MRVRESGRTRGCGDRRGSGGDFGVKKGELSDGRPFCRALAGKNVENTESSHKIYLTIQNGRSILGLATF